MSATRRDFMGWLGLAAAWAALPPAARGPFAADPGFRIVERDRGRTLVNEDALRRVLVVDATAGPVTVTLPPATLSRRETLILRQTGHHEVLILGSYAPEEG